MKINKAIAKEEVSVLKGIPSVHEYYNDQRTKTIDILSCKNSIQEGIQAYATIGLNKTNIGLVVDSCPLRVELVGACDIRNEEYGNIISSVAFEIMDAKECFPGYIVENVINQYFSNGDMQHILLTYPFLWENLKTVFVENTYVTWLMLVPISEDEMEYAKEKGIDALEDLFEKKQIDIFNMHRDSVI